MRVIFSGGGTAGHITPALAIADTIRATYPNAKIIFYGGEYGLERELVTKAGYPFVGFTLEGIRRSLSPKNIRAIYRAMQAFRLAKQALRKDKPDLVVGTGGYVCWPVLRAASALGIPTALHESNATLGLAAKLLIKKMDLMLLGQKDALSKCQGAQNVHFVGNPIRTSFKKQQKQQAKVLLHLPKHSKLILSFGGSLGASTLNAIMLDVMHTFSTKQSQVYHVHVTGKKGSDTFLADPRAKALSSHPRIEIHAYLHDLPKYLSAADVVICRAGAMTLSEVALTETPAILIPSPNVTGDHQTKNATVFAQSGAAILLPEQSLTADALVNTLTQILFDPEQYDSMRSAMQKLATPNANQDILALLSQYLQKNQ